jgi:hypothetical protein
MSKRDASIVLNDLDIRSFREDGFAVLTDAFAADALAAEMDDVFADAFGAETMQDGAGGIRFASVPMMSERTPSSSFLADALAKAAANALGRAVLPGRAKGTNYLGDSAWHSDSDLNIPSAGFVAYLEPLRRGCGALEVLPGTHTRTSSTRTRESVALETQPGDIVAFDEHLIHGSNGGGNRRQWRVDFIAAPLTNREEDLVRRSFAQIFDLKWDGGYDVDRYPSFGDWWQRAHPEWSTRLDDLGVIDMARAHEAVMRERRNASST